MNNEVLDLLKKYDKTNIFDLVKPINNINFNIDDFKKNMTFIKNGYGKSILFKDNKYEVVLICWDKNCETKIHNHPKNGCIMKILQGVLIEECFDKTLKNIDKHIFKKNEISYIHDNLYLHKIINEDQVSISLHIYSPPNFYD